MAIKPQAAINYFTERVESLKIEDPPEIGTSGLWQVKVQVVLVPMLQAIALHPYKPPVCFQTKEARDLAWKLVGMQINMKPFQWDRATEDI